MSFKTGGLSFEIAKAVYKTASRNYLNIGGLVSTQRITFLY